jgi:hypothetical protein
MGVVTTQGYKSIRKFDTNQLFPVQKEGKWGLIDTSGRVVAKPAYKEMLYSTEGLYGVKFDNGKYGFIDKKGKYKLPSTMTKYGLSIMAWQLFQKAMESLELSINSMRKLLHVHLMKSIFCQQLSNSNL